MLIHVIYINLAEGYIRARLEEFWQKSARIYSERRLVTVLRKS